MIYKYNQVLKYKKTSLLILNLDKNLKEYYIWDLDKDARCWVKEKTLKGYQVVK